MDFYTQLFLLCVLIVFSAFFAFAEISLAGSRRARLQTLWDEGDARAKKVMDTQDKPGKFFSVVQIGINMVAILGGIVGESVFSPFFTEIYGKFLATQTAQQAGFVTSFVIVTFCFVMFADLLPKRLAISNPEKVAMLCTGPMKFLTVLFRPIVWFLEVISNTILTLIGVPTTRRDKITSDDILASVGAGAAAGVIAPSEQAVIENVFNLESRTVPSAMTARESVIYILIDDDDEEVMRKIKACPHNHFLVCDGSLDHVLGVVESKNILRLLLDGHPVSLKDPGLLQPVQFIPDTLTLSEILENFQKTRTDFAVILNEYALVVGIITLNDVMSTVMSDLVLTPDESQIVQRDDNSWLVDGATPTVDLIHELEIDELPESQAYETVSGFMMYMLRKIPKRTDKIDWNGFRFEVMNVDKNKIDQVLITKLSALTKAKKEASAKEAPAKEGATPAAPAAKPAESTKNK